MGGHSSCPLAAKAVPVMMSLLQASEVPNLLEQLQECNVQLDIVEKGLNDLLDTKKMAFPRCCLLLVACRVKQPVCTGN